MISLLETSVTQFSNSRCLMHRNSDTCVSCPFNFPSLLSRFWTSRDCESGCQCFDTSFYKNLIACATCLPLRLLWSHTALPRRDIAFRDSKLHKFSVLETPDTLNPDFFGPSNTHPNRWTVFICQDIAFRTIAIPVEMGWRFYLQNPDARYYV
jgi:hypothetical protein